MQLISNCQVIIGSLMRRYLLRKRIHFRQKYRLESHKVITRNLRKYVRERKRKTEHEEFFHERHTNFSNRIIAFYRMVHDRQHFLKKKKAAEIIGRCFKRLLSEAKQAPDITNKPSHDEQSVSKKSLLISEDLQVQELILDAEEFLERWKQVVVNIVSFESIKNHSASRIQRRWKVKMIMLQRTRDHRRMKARTWMLSLVQLIFTMKAKESHSCIRITRWWRQVRVNHMISNMIAQIILESKMKKEKAAAIIQLFWKSIKHRRRIIEQQIEKRNYHIQVKKNARIKIQSWWRQILATISYRQMFQVQSSWKTMVVTLIERKRSQAAMIIQPWIHYKLNKQRRFCAATTIQLTLKYFMQHKVYRRKVQSDKMLKMVLKIQANIRSKLLRLELEKYRSAMVVIQKAWKRCIIRQKIKEAIKAEHLRLRDERLCKKHELQQIIYEKALSNFRQRIRSKAACKIQKHFREHVHKKRKTMKKRLEREFQRLQQVKEAKRLTAMLRSKQENKRAKRYMNVGLALLNKAKPFKVVNAVKIEISRYKDEPKNRKQILFDLLNPSGDTESIHVACFRKYLKEKMRDFRWFNGRLEKLMLQYFIWPNDMLKIRK